jgi:type III secretion system YscD/HrpQ family protein
MAAKLVAEDGSQKGLVLAFEKGTEWVIGRDKDVCQLLIDDPSASRKHALCKQTAEGITIENLSQTNPTEVNDQEVKAPTVLKDNDVIKIGDGIFRFHADGKEIPSQKQEEASIVESSIEESSIADTSMTESSIAESSIADSSIADSSIAESSIAETPSEASVDKAPEKEAAAVATETPPKEEPNPQEPKPQEIKTEEPKQEEAKPETPPTADEMLSELSTPPSDAAIKEEEAELEHDTIFDEEPSDKHALAQINFGLLDTGRWLLKVIGGPNNGAEFSMQAGSSYIIGTDPNSCDIVFHDTSVSRQHARISVAQDEKLSIEDLKSRNGTIVDGEPLKGKRDLATNMLVSLGTTSFIVFDREGEMQTIISPLMPSIVKVLQEEQTSKDTQTEEEKMAAAAAAAQALAPPPETHHQTTIGAFILIGIITGLFVIVGIGTSTLFKSEPVNIAQVVNPNQALDTALTAFPSVKYTFNKNTGQLLLVGHVSTSTDKNQLLYALRGMNFIRNIDDSGLVIDEFVWREINQVMEKNPDWKGISVIATEPGHFVVTGYLKTQDQSDRLSEYLSSNFPYPDLLEMRVIVDEEIVNDVKAVLQKNGIRGVAARLDNGEIILTGNFAPGKETDYNNALNEIKNIRGVRSIRNATAQNATEESLINISDKYEVSGVSSQGGNLSVVINGRILMKGDVLDGMAITSIKPTFIMLEKEGIQYRIDFKR